MSNLREKVMNNLSRYDGSPIFFEGKIQVIRNYVSKYNKEHGTSFKTDADISSGLIRIYTDNYFDYAYLSIDNHRKAVDILDGKLIF